MAVVDRATVYGIGLYAVDREPASMQPARIARKRRGVQAGCRVLPSGQKTYL